MGIYKEIFFAALLLPFVTISVHAQDLCAAMIETALSASVANCTDIGRNQACYGNAGLAAVGRTDNFVFDHVGDIADAANIDSISALPADVEANVWGLAVLSVQANLPDALPGQNATIFVLGNTTIDNLAKDSLRITAEANTSARVRSAPVTGQPLRTLDAGTRVIVFGRNEAADWLRVVDSENAYGWVADFLLDIESDISLLPVVDTDAVLPPNPMQAFVVRSGGGQSGCAGAPDGVLIHAPSDADPIQLTINGANISIASTVLVQTQTVGEEATLLIQTYEGSVVVSNEFGVSLVPAGAQTRIALDTTGDIPLSAPAEPEPISQTDLDTLTPIIRSHNYLAIVNEETAPAVIEEALTQEQITELNSIPEDVSTMSGTWQWTFSVRYEGGASCYISGQLPGEYGGLVTFEFTDTGLTTTNSRGFTTTYDRVGQNTYTIFDTASFTFTVVSPVFMTYQRLPVSTYTENGVNCVQTIDGYAVKVG